MDGYIRTLWYIYEDQTVLRRACESQEGIAQKLTLDESFISLYTSSDQITNSQLSSEYSGCDLPLSDMSLTLPGTERSRGLRSRVEGPGGDK